MFPTQELDDRQLRFFGGSLSALILVVAGLTYWKWQSVPVSGGIALLAVLALVVYYSVPSTRRPIYRVFRAVTLPIQIAVTVVILSIVYFGILTPIGLVLRLRGGGVRKSPDACDSFWVTREESSEPSRYFDTY